MTAQRRADRLFRMRFNGSSRATAWLAAIFLFMASLNFLASSRAQGIDWAVRMGGLDIDTARNVSVDQNGNLRVMGPFRGTAEIFGTTLDAGAGTGAFVASLTPGGTLLWLRQMSATTDLFCNGMDVDGFGNTYVAIGYTGTLTIGNTTLTGGRSFIAKYDANGNFQWVRRYGFTASRVAVDGAGNAYVSGLLNAANTVDGVTLTPYATYDYYVAKFSTSGVMQWVRRRAGSHLGAVGQQSAGAATDAAGNNYLIGVMEGSVKFDDEAPFDVADPETFLVKTDPNGQRLWHQSFGGGIVSLTSNGSGFGNERGCAVDPDGNVCLVSNLRGTATIGATTLSNPNTVGLVFAKYSANGDPVWARQTVGANFNQARNIATDRHGNVYVSGRFTGTVAFGATQLIATGDSDLFITKLDANGSFLWAAQSSGTGEMAAIGVAVNDCGDVFLSGQFNMQKSLGANLIATGGSYDAFIARINAETLGLTLARSGGSGVFSWPASAAGCYRLQAAPALPAVAGWTDVQRTPARNGDRIEVSVDLGPDSQFFRLARP